MITRAIENAQRKVEGHHFDIRKHLLEYDDVMNKQREIIYRQRREVLEGDNLQQVLQDMVDEVIDGITAEIAQERLAAEDWDWEYCSQRVLEIFGRRPEWSEEERSGFKTETLREKIAEVADQARRAQEEANGADNQRQIERLILLQVVDSHWKEHLLSMDHLKEGIGLRGYGQKNPLNEYKKEAFNLFGEMIDTVKLQTIKTLMHVRLVQPDEVERLEEQRRRRQEQEMRLNKGPTGDEQKGAETIKRDGDKIGRNAPCPCGSGKKYKKCCGRMG
jgi:preprotein translocase subunit SecA